jgi:hypothetical protein
MPAGAPPVFRPGAPAINAKPSSRVAALETRPAPPVYNPFGRAVAAKAAAPAAPRSGSPVFRPLTATPIRPPARTIQRAESGRIMFPGDFMEELERVVDSPAYQQSLPPAEYVEPDFSPKPAAQREQLSTVTLSSAIHHAEQLGQKYKDVVTQPWGFSFAKKSTQQEDLAAINAYITKWNAGEKVVKIHASGGGNKIQYTVNDRIYSTHEDSSQLYPISGPGIASGNGPSDMYYLLSELGKAEAAKVIKLAEQLKATKSAEFAKAAAEKMEGGHRSGVKVPKAKTSSAATLKLMKGGVLEKAKTDAEKELRKQPKSAQYSNRLDEDA